eukprot:6136862-Alexandrium_andersonii.AAC.1
MADVWILSLLDAARVKKTHHIIMDSVASHLTRIALETTRCPHTWKAWPARSRTWGRIATDMEPCGRANMKPHGHTHESTRPHT